MSEPTTIRRASWIAAAFLRMGWLNAIGYPLSFVMSQLSAVMPVVIFFFVARFTDGVAVGGDYFTFVVVGLIGTQVLTAGLQGFGQELEATIQQGRFEMLLAEPVPWRALPLAIVQVPVLIRLSAAGMIVAVAIPLGAHFDAGGAWTAIGLLGLSLVAGFALGMLAGSIKVLAKRGDPILAIYTLAASVVSGVYFPIDALPLPLRWLAWMLPNTYAISALRSALIPGAATIGGPTAGQALGALLAFTLILSPFAVWLFGRSLRYGRRMGLLGGY